MTITAIAAMDRNGVIGDGERLPWHLPKDLRRFRRLTMGKPVVMGRRTFESLPGPLPGRLNIVLSRSRRFDAPDVASASLIGEALAAAATRGDETMIIGGGQIYAATSHLWDRLLLTIVDGEFGGSVRFPFDPRTDARWTEAASEYHLADSDNPHGHWFIEYRRGNGRVGP